VEGVAKQRAHFLSRCLGPVLQREEHRDHSLDRVGRDRGDVRRVLELDEEARQPESGGELARIEVGGAHGVDDGRGDAGDHRDDHVVRPHLALEGLSERGLLQACVLLRDSSCCGDCCGHLEEATGIVGVDGSQVEATA